MLSFFRRDGLDEILNLIESVSEGFPTFFSAVKPYCDVCDGVFLCCSFSHEVSWMRSWT